jgi:hypothetical protein
MTWANGDQYTGLWSDGQINGNGTMTWANGDQYTGSWLDGQ